MHTIIQYYIYIICILYIICIQSYITIKRVTTSDVNNAEPRLLVIDGEPRLSFSEKTSPSRVI